MCIAVTHSHWLSLCVDWFIEMGEYFAQHPDERLGHVLDGELAAHVNTVCGGADSAVPEDPQLSVTLQILFAYYNFATAVFHPEVVQDVVGVAGQVGLDVAVVPGNLFDNHNSLEGGKHLYTLYG